MWSLMTTRGQVLAIPRLPALLGSGQGADVRVPRLREALPPHRALQR